MATRTKTAAAAAAAAAAAETQRLAAFRKQLGNRTPAEVLSVARNVELLNACGFTSTAKPTATTIRAKAGPTADWDLARQLVRMQLIQTGLATVTDSQFEPTAPEAVWIDAVFNANAAEPDKPRDVVYCELAGIPLDSDGKAPSGCRTHNGGATGCDGVSGAMIADRLKACGHYALFANRPAGSSPPVIMIENGTGQSRAATRTVTVVDADAATDYAL